MPTREWIITYIVAVNLLGFAAMGIDKLKAKKHAWRIPEATLFSIAIIGGSLGSIIGMRVFHHKTKHKKFTVGLPLIFLLELALALALVFNPGIKISIL